MLMMLDFSMEKKHISYYVARVLCFLQALLFVFSPALLYAEDVGDGYFDDAPLTFSPSLKKAPMYTLVGITDWGKDILQVYGLTTIITLIVFICVTIPIIYVLIRFRARGDQEELPPQTKGNYLLEIVWTIIPVVLLVIIATPTWQSIFRQDKAVKKMEQSADALKIKVIGHQWWWEFVYTDYNVTTANELVLPEKTPVIFSITSADVIHSFYIPRFGGKLDAIPGKINKLVYTSPSLTHNASSKGDYYLGQCMELCGVSHALMRFEAVIRSHEEFESFLASHNKPPQVKTSQEKRGEMIFNQCIACHTIAGTPSADIPVEKIGPDLSNFGDRRTLAAGTRHNNTANLEAWIKDPFRFKPGSLMPKLELTDEQIEDVSAYIQFSTAKY